MKQRLMQTLRGVFCTVSMAAVLAVSIPSGVLAAPNQGTGDIAGVGADLTDSNTFNLTGQQLALVKRAYLASTGAALTDGATLATGTDVKFMIYVNNSTDTAVNDISIQDVLDPAFLYQAGTIRVGTDAECTLAACTGPEEDARFVNVDIAANARTDAAGDDTASFAGTTLDVGDQTVVTNTQLDVPANTFVAVIFTVRMQ